MIYKRPVIRILTPLLFLERLVPRPIQPPADMDWRARKLKEFIDQHQGNHHWKLGEACRALGFPMSDRQARRLFKVSMGMGIREYSRNKRLAYAVQQLRTTNTPVKAIAIDVGYRTTGHFARSFKELFFLTPMEFRRVYRLTEVAA